uniref:Uncharacterized protein n=1 Tax=Cebus imitator TaxID=2715852 RepID=A0A2K5PTK7_CEBIM
VASKLLRTIILGPPGSGKGTVCQRVAQNFALQHLSNGPFLPENIKPYTEVGEMAKQCIEKSLLVPDHVITCLMMSKLTLGQAKALDRICEADLMISLNIPFETLKNHLSGIDDVTGEPLVQQEDDKPEAVAARLRRYKDVAKPVIGLYRSRGLLHQFSGMERNKIWPSVYTLFSNKITPIQSKEAY